MSGCGIFLPRNDLSEQTRAETVEIKIKLAKVDQVQEQNAIPAVVAAAIPVLIDYGFKFVQSEIEREAKRYTSSYSAAATDWSFFMPEVTTQGNTKVMAETSALRPKTRFQGFTLTRMVRLRDASEDAARVDALRLVVASESSPDGAFFRLVPQSIEIMHPRCKLIDGDNTVDLEIRVKFDSFWTDANGVAKQNTAEPPPLLIKDIPLGTEGDRSDEEIVFVNRQLQAGASLWIPSPPRSVLKTDGSVQSGTGIYAIRVEVIERDDFGKRVAKVGEYVADNRESWAGELAEAVLKALGGGGEGAK